MKLIIILGQNPYHSKNQTTCLYFQVNKNTKKKIPIIKKFRKIIRKRN